MPPRRQKWGSKGRPRAPCSRSEPGNGSFPSGRADDLLPPKITCYLVSTSAPRARARHSACEAVPAIPGVAPRAGPLRSRRSGARKGRPEPRSQPLGPAVCQTGGISLPSGCSEGEGKQQRDLGPRPAEEPTHRESPSLAYCPGSSPGETAGRTGPAPGLRQHPRTLGGPLVRPELGAPAGTDRAHRRGGLPGPRRLLRAAVRPAGPEAARCPARARGATARNSGRCTPFAARPPASPRPPSTDTLPYPPPPLAASATRFGGRSLPKVSPSSGGRGGPLPGQAQEPIVEGPAPGIRSLAPPRRGEERERQVRRGGRAGERGRGGAACRAGARGRRRPRALPSGRCGAPGLTTPAPLGDTRRPGADPTAGRNGAAGLRL